MNELKQKILEGIRISGLSEWAFTVDDDCYGMVSYERLTDDDIDELATYILDEIINQPTLNENQQRAIKKLKEEYPYRESILSAIYWVIEDDSIPYIDDKETSQVLQTFSQWALESEEE